MIEYINPILEFIINIAIVLGLCFLIYFFIKLKNIDTKIEAIRSDFEKERDLKRKQKIAMEYIIPQISQLEIDMAEKIASFQREREAIISKIPFIK